ncbi:MAG TPA: hypothetical protein VD816_00395 [Ohtaekwangia sp.]|nr:hypothetical protein [Ohtaekwangia sp.]
MKVEGKLPSTVIAFLPVVAPIALIAMRSFLSPGNEKHVPLSILLVMGDPVIALAIGVLLAFIALPSADGVHKSLYEAAEKAGGILVIIGAGGAFGGVLAATNIGLHFSEALPLGTLGILFPFLLTVVLKTAQGSSTVAIITASSIVLPLLSPLGLDSDNGRLLCVLSMGAGSMMISHANDAYFWVISRFQEIQMNDMLRVYSVATMLMGLVTFLMVFLLSIF